MMYMEPQTPPTQVNYNEPMQKNGIALKTLLLIVILAVVAGALVLVAVYQKQQTQIVKQIPTPTPNPVQTILSISSIPTPLATPSSYLADILINTGSNKINSVQLELSYDPKVLTKVDIVPGSFFVDPVVSIKNVDEVNGRISLVLNASGPKEQDNGVVGQNIVAQIKFSIPKALKLTNTSISFLPKTQVLGNGFSTSLLKSSIDANFSLGVSPTPTKSPIASPTATLN